MNRPDRQVPSTSVTFSMLISEAVYKLVIVCERSIRWLDKFVLRPCMLQIRCLLW